MNNDLQCNQPRRSEFLNHTPLNVSKTIIDVDKDLLQSEKAVLPGEYYSQINNDLQCDQTLSSELHNHATLNDSKTIMDIDKDQLQSEKAVLSEQQSHILKVWNIIISYLVDTRVTQQVLKSVKRDRFVTASSCTVHTASQQHVALNIVVEGYDFQLLTHPHDLYNPNQKTLFEKDNFCGAYLTEHLAAKSFKSVMECIKIIIQKIPTTIILEFRKQVNGIERFEYSSICSTCVCNLIFDDLCLSQTRQLSLEESCLESKVTQNIQYCDFYCALYSGNFEHDITEFFHDPSEEYVSEFKMCYNNRRDFNYSVLVLWMNFVTRLNKEWSTDEFDTEMKLIVENTHQACTMHGGSSQLSFQDELNVFEHTFNTKNTSLYKTTHDEIFDFLVDYFEHKIVKCLMTNEKGVAILEKLLFHQMLIQRLIDDWSNGMVIHVFNEINKEVPKFRQIFLNHLKSLDNSLQRQLAKTCDVINKDTVLLRCCEYNYLSFIQWYFVHGVDINKCNINGLFPLYVSSRDGNTDVVKILLDNKADINKCTDTGESPLFSSCQRNCFEVVKILLHNKADINKCNGTGLSPLYIACQNNHFAIVKMLLDNNADINKSTNKGESPLYSACLNNHIEMVKILLDHKAAINKFTFKAAPLFVLLVNITILK